MLGRIASKLPRPVVEAIRDRVLPDLLPEKDVAPEWHLQSWDGSWHRLRKQWSLLFFYPSDDCPESVTYLKALEAARERLAALDCAIYAINAAEAPEHEALARREGLGFPILVDRGGAVARRYRATLPRWGRPRVLHVTYLVNPERRVRLANRGTPSIEAIARTIEALRDATREGM